MVVELSKLNTTLDRKILPLAITSADVNGGTDNYRMIMEHFTNLTVNINDKIVPAYRRVIVSTNVAETGLTLESLRYCIDTALQFTNEFNPRYGLNIMMTKPTTSSMSLQRKGRVGRKHAGVFFPLFTEHTFNHMIVDNTPSIMVEDMTSHLLALLINEPTSLNKLPVYDMLTPPSDDSIRYSLCRLFALGAIDSNGAPTATGRMMNTFRKISVESSKMILSGLAHGASIKELVCLACVMGIRKTELVLDKRDTGVTPYDTSSLLDEVYQVDAMFKQSSCDTVTYSQLRAKLLIGCEMLELLLIYQRFYTNAAIMKIGALKRWCLEKGLNYWKLCKLAETIDEVYWQMVEQLKINPVSQDMHTIDLYQTLKRSNGVDNTEMIDAVIKLKKCIYEGYKNNLLIWSDSENSYMTPIGLKVTISSKLVSQLSYQKSGMPFEQDRPRLIIFKELMYRQDRSGLFVNEASLISIMDGFVHVDTEFCAL
jgi:HrpA-like RNA helicase